MATLFLGLGVDYPRWLYKLEVAEGWVIDISAAVIVMIITALICRGVEGSARTNTLMTGFNLLIIVFVIFVGAGEIEPRNYDPPFLPHGAAGVLRGAAVVFFAYIGFDACAPLPSPAKHVPSLIR